MRFADPTGTSATGRGDTASDRETKRRSTRGPGRSRSASRCRHAIDSARPGFRRASGGFSFIEIMVVVVIIGLLAGAVAISVRGHVDKAKVNRARSDIATIVDALETYYAEHGRFPTNEEGLSVLDINHTKDPWGRRYQYNRPGKDAPYEVVCYGADGREGGTGPDRDIISANLEQTAESSR